jgi:hypothetical protein
VDEFVQCYVLLPICEWDARNGTIEAARLRKRCCGNHRVGMVGPMQGNFEPDHSSNTSFATILFLDAVAESSRVYGKLGL